MVHVIWTGRHILKLASNSEMFTCFFCFLLDRTATFSLKSYHLFYILKVPKTKFHNKIKETQQQNDLIFSTNFNIQHFVQMTWRSMQKSIKNTFCDEGAIPEIRFVCKIFLFISIIFLFITICIRIWFCNIFIGFIIIASYIVGFMLQLSVTMMSWVQVWVDLRLFTSQFSDKVLLDTWKLRERE